MFMSYSFLCFCIRFLFFLLFFCEIWFGYCFFFSSFHSFCLVILITLMTKYIASPYRSSAAFLVFCFLFFSSFISPLNCLFMSSARVKTHLLFANEYCVHKLSAGTLKAIAKIYAVTLHYQTGNGVAARKNVN